MSETEADLQLALNSMYDYCQLWKLTVNTTKTKIIIFSKGKIRNKPVFLYSSFSMKF